MANISRTVNPLHFEDFESHRFEDMIRQLAYCYRSWRSLEATGRLGSDGGVDIRGVEMIQAAAESVDGQNDEGVADPATGPILDERVWLFQCKRYKRIHPKLMRDIVKEAVPDVASAPYGLIVAAACDVSEKAITAFHDERIKRGVSEGHLWTRAHLEDMLFRPENDLLLFAYFGFSLMTKRRSQVREIQDRLTLKRQIMAALEITNIADTVSKDILVRDVNDLFYPREDAIQDFQKMKFSPWHTATFREFAVDGVIIDMFRDHAWFKHDGTWDFTQKLRQRCGLDMDKRRSGIWSEEKNAATAKRLAADRALSDNIPIGELAIITVSLLLPYSAILAIDHWGDPSFQGPHLFCQFTDADEGPYDLDYGCLLSSYGTPITQGTDDDKKRPLFDSLFKELPADLFD